MKLASLKGGRDGKLIVVDRGLSRYTDASAIAPTLQAALDEWSTLSPQLEQVSRELEAGRVQSAPFDARAVAAPLPRAFQWVDAAAYVAHSLLMREDLGEKLPPLNGGDGPLIWRGASDRLSAARDDIVVTEPEWQCDVEGEVAVITGDVPRGASRAEALGAVQLLGMVNDISMRRFSPLELTNRFGFVHSKPESAFSPVFVTPDEWGDSWRDGKLHCTVKVDVNGTPLVRANAAEDMPFDFGELVCATAKTRAMGTGSIICSGAVSNRGPDGRASTPVDQGGGGYACFADIRAVEELLHGEAKTSFLRPGDVVRMWAENERGESVFGAIEQSVVSLNADRKWINRNG